jgi:hypothetical protein
VASALLTLDDQTAKVSDAGSLYPSILPPRVGVVA